MRRGMTLGQLAKHDFEQKVIRLVDMKDTPTKALSIKDGKVEGIKVDTLTKLCPWPTTVHGDTLYITKLRRS